MPKPFTFCAKLRHDTRRLLLLHLATHLLKIREQLHPLDLLLDHMDRHVHGPVPSLCGPGHDRDVIELDDIRVA